MSVQARRSIEALRSGVPNRSAVRELGTDQREIEGRFLNMLSQLAAERQMGRQLPGFMIQGEFGTGKSHLLEWLQHLCLEQGFASSKVVISKETPLGDPHKVFRAAMESLRLPDRVGGVEELAECLRSASLRNADFYGRVQDPGLGFDPLFQATTFIFERLKTHKDIVDEIVRFWGGDRLSLIKIRGWLREVGNVRYELRSRKIQDLALPRFRFAAELVAAAGYTGWVILLDEIELVATLSLIARARAYAVLAALTGQLAEQVIPGLFAVGTVTAEFTGVVFHERRDHERIPQKWGERGVASLADIEAGMGFLQPESRQWMRITSLDAGALAETHEKVRSIYSQAYGWEPPTEPVRVNGKSVRQHLRDWITRWDLIRLDPGPAYAERIVVCDSARFDTLLALPL